MFRVNLYCDGYNYHESYNYYDYAVKAFENFDRIYRGFKADGRIDDYYIELIKED